MLALLLHVDVVLRAAVRVPWGAAGRAGRPAARAVGVEELVQARGEDASDSEKEEKEAERLVAPAPPGPSVPAPRPTTPVLGGEHDRDRTDESAHAWRKRIAEAAFANNDDVQADEMSKRVKVEIIDLTASDLGA